MIELFERYALAAGAQVTIVPDQAAASIIADGADGDLKCTAAVRESYPDLIRALEASGRQVAVAEEMAEGQPSRQDLAAALAGGTGIVLARAGVAETGSLVLADNALAPRL